MRVGTRHRVHLLRVDGHADVLAGLLLWTSRIDPGATSRLPKEVRPTPASSARSVFGTRRDVTDRRCRLPLSVLGASLSTCCSRFGARRAYSTPRPLSRAMGDRSFCSASAAPSSLPGCPGRSGRVGASLKEPHKVTTESLLCQVEGGRAESPILLPRPTRRQQQDCK